MDSTKKLKSTNKVQIQNEHFGFMLTCLTNIYRILILFFIVYYYFWTSQLKDT